MVQLYIMKYVKQEDQLVETNKSVAGKKSPKNSMDDQLFSVQLILNN